jgi:hypothetical protein
MVERLVNTVNRIPNMGRYFTSSKPIESAINQVNIEYFKTNRGNTGFYRPNAPFSPMAFGQTTINSDYLAPFLRTQTFNTSPTLNNQIDVNDPDGREIDSILSVQMFYRTTTPSLGLKVFPPNQYPQMVASEVVPPTKKQPYGLMIGENSFFYQPVAATSYLAQYLVVPKPCIFTYTGEMFQGVPVLRVEQDLEWPDIHLDKFVYGVLKILGINMQRSDIIQLANQESKT